MASGPPDGSVVKYPPANTGDVGSLPWRRKWQPLQYSCLGSSVDRGAWWTVVHGVAKGHDLATEQYQQHGFRGHRVSALQSSG